MAAGKKRQRAVSLRRGSKSKKAKKSSAVITRPKLGVSKLSKSRRNNAGVKKKGGVKRRGGVQQTHKGRATVPIPTPSGVESSAVEEKEGLLQGSRPKEGKEGSGQKKKKQLVAQRKLLSKQERKKLRKKGREAPTTMAKAKAIWEVLRRHDCSKSQRSELITKLTEVTKGSVRELIVKHDTARVFQCMLQHGTAEQRDSVFSELEGCMKDLVKLRYAKHLVLKMLKYGTPSQRYSVIKSFHGHVCRLVRHKEAADVLETAYNDYATALQRSELLLEFCGPEYAHFKPPEVLSLSALLEENPGKREAVLKYIHGRVLSVIDRPSFKHSIVHQVLLDYLTHAGEKEREDMIELVRERLVEILHTKEGARATMRCIWHGRPKDRKAIVKSFKGFVKKICKEEHGYLVLLAAFDTVDDTVLVGKALLAELCEDLEEVCADPHGSRVLLYLLNPRSPRHFKKSFCAILEGGDGNKYSKKPRDVRCQELLATVSPSFIHLAKEKVEEWIRDKHLCQLLLETVSSAQGDVLPILESILELVREEFEEEGHIIADPVGHFVIKGLIIAESKACESGQQLDRKSFAEMVLDSVAADVLKEWATVNRGAFVLASMVQSKAPQVAKRTAGALKSMLPFLKASDGKGQQALAKDIERALSSQHTH